MYTVSYLAREANVSADTVRHYVKLDLLKPKRHQRNGYKIFSTDDVMRVQFIKNAKSLGFSLREISEIFSHSLGGNSPCPEVRETLKQRIEYNKLRVEGLIALQNRMKEALQLWQDMPNGSPDGSSICHLIELMSIGLEND